MPSQAEEFKQVEKEEPKDDMSLIADEDTEDFDDTISTKTQP